MKTALAFLFPAIVIISILAMGWAAAHASESDCGLIRDHDLRATCYARATHSASECGLIYDNDERRLCRAQSGDRR